MIDTVTRIPINRVSITSSTAIICSFYEKVKEITTEEKKLLYCHLAYPEKFWKIANHYNNSKKVWLSDRNLEKIEKVIEQERSREEFLENLFDFIKE